MECCISPTDQTVLLDVATLNPAIEIAPASMQPIPPSLENNVLSVATSVEDSLLHVATSHNTDISQTPAPIDRLSRQSGKVNELSEATTSEHFTMPLYVATHDKGVTEMINRYPTSKTDIDQNALLVATKTNSSYEQSYLTTTREKSIVN